MRCYGSRSAREQRENLVILGKSDRQISLIKCLVGLVTPEEGEIRIFGEDLLSLNYSDLNGVRIRTGFLFQNAALYDSMTVRENLCSLFVSLKRI